MCLSLSASDDLKSMRLKRATLFFFFPLIFSATRCSLRDGMPWKRTLKLSADETLSAILVGSLEKSPESSSAEVPSSTLSQSSQWKSNCGWMSDERTADPPAAYASTRSKKFPNIFVVISDANKSIHCSFCSHKPSFTCRLERVWQHDLLLMHLRSFQMNT